MELPEITLQESFKCVYALANQFKEHTQKYLSPDYQEAEVRKDFIDKFFIALGWDVNHDYQINPYAQEVKVEKSQRQEHSRKRADYAFYLTPNFADVVFFVEAKKPSKQLRNNADYFQTMRYGWNSQCSISVLTDFEEFHIIDCRSKPNINYVFNGAHKVFHYTDYFDFDKFKELFFLFGREAVKFGSIQNYIKNMPKPSGGAIQTSLFPGAYKDIDESFLEYINSMRITLAKAFKSSDKSLNSIELTEATQRTIDRLVFIRFLEDKFIEPPDHIAEYGNHKTCWGDFILDCKSLDLKYNGVVFKKHFIDDINFSAPNDRVFSTICNEISNVNSPYHFNYIPVHILGYIYERFLGEVVIANAKGVKIDYKPEVRKAGGVYYTPKYIVDYIVNNSVGSIIKGKDPKDISKMHFIDISCGSGSFLLGVYDFLLKYYANYYAEKFKDQSKLYRANEYKGLCEKRDGQWVLTLKQKQNILLNNIFGVDIDKQAVEVTQLSLFLKLLEDESISTMQTGQGTLFSKVLPDLSNNIRWGNSLIDNYPVTQNSTQNIFASSIKPFNFIEGFPNVIKDGGFDCIIGNPPYIKEYTDKSAFEIVKAGYLSRYYQGKMDMWYFFVCHGLDLLKNGGMLGYIAPNNWITNAGASKMREKILSESLIDKYIDFNDYHVFRDASIQTMIFVLLKKAQQNDYTIKYQKVINKKISSIDLFEYLLLGKTSDNITITTTTISPLKTDSLITFTGIPYEKVLTKISERANFFLDENNVAQGIVSPQENVIERHLSVLKNPLIKKGMGIFVLTQEEVENLNLSPKELDIIKPYYTSNELHRYYGDPYNKYYIIYSDISVRSNIDNYPKIKHHISKFAKVITSDFAPYGLHRARDERFFVGEKILSYRKAIKPYFTYTDFPCYVSQTYYIIKPKDIDLKYLTGILNSQLVFFWLYLKGKKQGEQLQIDKVPLLGIPLIKDIQGNIINEVSALVDRVINTIRTQVNIRSDSEKEQVGDYLNSLYKKIDEITYNLYGLNDSDIGIIKSFHPN